MFAASAPGGAAPAARLTRRIAASARGSAAEKVSGPRFFGSGARSTSSTPTRSRARARSFAGASTRGKGVSSSVATRVRPTRAPRSARFVARAASESPYASKRPKVSPEFECPRLTATRDLPALTSPFAEGGEKHGYGLGQKFVADDDCVLLNALRYEALEFEGNPNAEGCELNLDDDFVDAVRDPDEWRPTWAMRAGPREKIYFDPAKCKAAIVTCGGLCPGLNDVIRQLVITLEEYVAAKGGQIGWSRSMASEMAPSGITVNTVAPGWIPTERHANDPQEALDAYFETIPMGRWGTPKDVGDAVAFFASDEASFLTGQTLCVNGGRTPW